MTRVALVMGALALIAACTGSGTGSGTGGYVSGNGRITVVPDAERDEAPVLAGKDLAGNPISTDDYAGKVLVVNVWGSWCPPCRAEAPALKAVSEEYSDDVQFIGVLVRDKPASALAFNRKYDITYPSISDASGRTLLGFADSLPSQAIPTTWILDRHGRVAARAMDEVSEATLSGLLDDVLAESS